MTHSVIPAGLADEMIEIRHRIHAHPELGFEEFATSDLVAEQLQAWGYTVHRGLGGTGVVAQLKVGNGTQRLGLRADMDALPIHESTGLPYQSTIPGKMHACGHDGHTAMLLAAAKHLARERRFSGTLNLIFQPAEEGLGGAKKMLDDGLFEQFPCDAIFAMHNMPGFPTGKFGFLPGPFMASSDTVIVDVQGRGGHGAVPHKAIDSVVVCAQIVIALQTIVSRNVSPHNSAVVTVGAFQSGNAGNVIAQSAILRLSIRTKTPADRELVLDKVKTLARTQAEGYGCTCEIRQGVPGAVLVNDKEETLRAAELARVAFGEEDVVYPGPTFLGSEDFAFMLQKKKGTYCFIGNGDTPMVHHPRFTLNQDILPKGAAYWVALTEGYLRGT